MARSTFSQLGLPIGENTTNMTYLYGVSDFFTVMFEDPEKVNLLMEAEATACSEVYSRFLQLTSSVSLEDIQQTIGHSIKLVIISSADMVQGDVNVYSLKESITTSRYIANKPLLPDTLLEENIDYRLEPQEDGTVRIRFASDISAAGFSTRLQDDGVTKEYALWFVDCEVDEQLISKYFGNLVAIDAQASTDVFKNFVYGLFYMYANGPVLDLIRKGLNLALGIPLCRGTETVLEIRKYLETDQYIVITDANQYVIPYGLTPVVEEGQVLSVSDEIARWVEVQDYQSDGDWWINLRIPSSVIPALPSGQVDRYATAGSHYDYLMRTYLKKHTFLVKVKVTSFKEDQIFQELGKIIRRAKPAYTIPIYIWTVDQEDDLTLNDDSIPLRWDQFRCENLNLPIDKFRRDVSETPLKRGCPIFTRFTAPNYAARLTGSDGYINGSPDSFLGGIVNGYANYIRQVRNNTESERSWMRALLDRGSETVNGLRSRVGFFRGIHAASDSTFSYSGVPARTTAVMAKAVSSVRIIPLYATTQKDLSNKCINMGIRVPDLTEWTFDLLNITRVSNEIDSYGINEGLVDYTQVTLAANYTTLFFRGSDVNYLSNIMPDMAFNSWAPQVTDLRPGDYVMGIRVQDNILGMYWVTSNFDIQVPYANYVSDTESMTMSMTLRPSRGMAVTGSAYYMLRGRGSVGYNSSGLVINENAIDEAGQTVNGTVNNDYSDQLNVTPITFTRDGTKTLNHKMDVN